MIRPLRVERLEDRSLPSVSPTLNLSGLHVDRTRSDASRLLVQFKDDATPQALPGTTLGNKVPLVGNLYEVELQPGTSVEQALEAYLDNAQVVIAEPDHPVEVSWATNDPRLGEQWHLRNTGQNKGTAGADVRALAAWDVTTGSKRFPVAVIDSGIDYTHPDLYLSVWLNQGEIPASRLANLKDVDRDGSITFRDLNNPINQGPGKITDLNRNGFIDGGDLLVPMSKDDAGRDTGRGGWADGVSQDGDHYVDDLVGWNSNAGTNNPFDDYGHGTHLAGLISAVGNNGVGVSGVAWQVPVVPVKFFDRAGNGTISQFIAGLDWALAKGIKISNNSWTDRVDSPLLAAALNRARARGHLFVAAAGNHTRNTDSSPVYPAGYDLNNVVTVAATGRDDKLAGFSNWGPGSVDIAAPGVEILSTTPWGRYGVRSGTSMATPQVSAVMALVWGLRPEWTYRQVIDRVLQTADRLSSLNGKVASGRLNALAAVRIPARAGTVLSVQSQPTGTKGNSGLEAVVAMLAKKEENRRVGL